MAHDDTERDPRILGTEPTLASAPGSPAPAPRLTDERAHLVGTPGRYQVEREFARGGMGRVLVAREEGLGRRVAIKELLADDEETAGRFEREALITARLQHPAIVPLYEAGRADDGTPFYAMKLVSGRALDDLLAEKETLAERLALLPNLIAVADAIAYAHGEQVLHRDLKPGNVLVGKFGETVVIDWGLAKVRGGVDMFVSAGSRQLDDPGATQVGAVMGTPAYMPPEQARGEPVDERADVYAIGAILYELLAGRKAYGAPTGAVALAAVLIGPPPRLASVAPAAPPELVAIVEKAMARDRDDRYPTAAELVDDLRRFQTGQLVSAHRYGPWSLVRRFVARHRAAVAVSAASLVVLAVAGALAVRRIVAEKAVAVAAQRRAEARNDALVLEHARAVVASDPTAALAWLKLRAPDGATRIVAADAVAHDVARRHLRHDEAIQGTALALDGKTLVTSGSDATLRLWDLATGAARVLRAPAPIGDLALSPDGRRAVTVLDGGAPLLWTLADGTTTPLAWPAGDEHAATVAWSPDGRHVVATGNRGSVVVWDLDGGGAPRVLLERGKHVVLRTLICLSPDGTRLAFVAPGADQVRVATLADDGVVTLAAQPTAVTSIAFAPDGRHVAVAGEDATVRLLGLADGSARTFVAPVAGVDHLRFASGGRLLFGTAGTRLLLAWDLATGALTVDAAFTGAPVDAVADPASDLVAVATDAHAVEMWHARGGARATLHVSDPIFDTMLLPDARVAVAAGRAVQLFDDPFGRDARCDAGAQLNEAAITPDGHHVAAVGQGGRIARWDTRSRTCATDDDGGTAEIRALPDGSGFVTAAADGTVRRWPTDGGPGRVLASGAGKLYGLAIVDGGRAALAGGFDGRLRRIDLATGDTRVLATQPVSIFTLAAFPDGRRAATLGRDGRLRLYALDDGRLLADVEAGDDRLAVSPRGDAIAFSGRHGADGPHFVALVDADGGHRRELHQGGGPIFDLVWSAAGDRLLVPEGRFVHVWRSDGGEVRRLERASDVTAARFLDGDRVVATVDSANDLVLEDLGTGERRTIATDGLAVDAAFAPDGSMLFVPDVDGTLHAWRDPVPGDPAAFASWLASSTDATVDPSLVP